MGHISRFRPLFFLSFLTNHSPSQFYLYNWWTVYDIIYNLVKQPSKLHTSFFNTFKFGLLKDSFYSYQQYPIPFWAQPNNVGYCIWEKNKIILLSWEIYLDFSIHVLMCRSGIKVLQMVTVLYFILSHCTDRTKGGYSCLILRLKGHG